ncbi:hypothetical protein RGR602_PC02358 (plasmid) [Rhizobium gallicum bv. gallicum R602sp]|uniref:Uncharacterized protein n=1 Tax=Rhizobium gallicum bv. gallicum R602sp TaxID=1041138 RepID=A0A0B4XJ15_9HYPH|nr:hypothetical protein RGR602_PC02358 [Rhizobium gallicum bv. gallicum R602sp]
MQLLSDPSEKEEHERDSVGDACGSAGMKSGHGTGLLLLFIVGDILGTCIYAVTGRGAQSLGNYSGKRERKAVF